MPRENPGDVSPSPKGGGSGKAAEPSGPDAQKILDYAMQFQGTPYQWGGNDLKTGVDCSGLVQQVYNHFGMNLPRVSDQQSRAGKPIKANEARPGDLVYFANEPGDRPGVDHIGIYLGNGKMLVAPHTGTDVQVQNVGNAAGFDRVLPHGSWSSMRNNQGEIAYHPSDGTHIGSAPMGASDSALTGKGTPDLPDTTPNPSKTAAGLDQMGFASALINSNKSLKNAFNQIIDGRIHINTSAGQAEATRILQNTAWFQNHTTAQQKFEEQKYSEPAQFQNQIDQQKDSLENEAQTMGLTISGADLDQIARSSLRNGLSDDEISSALAHHFVYNANQKGGYDGTAGSAIQSIQQQAASQYVPITNQQIQKLTQQVLSGSLDPTSLGDRFQQQALSMYPYLKQQLDGGQTVADVANPYISMMANTLELNPDDIKQTDPTILGALQAKDAQGNLGLMTTSAFQQKLYEDPRWLQTENAHNSLLSTTNDVLQKMGLIT